MRKIIQQHLSFCHFIDGNTTKKATSRTVLHSPLKSLYYMPFCPFFFSLCYKPLIKTATFTDHIVLVFLFFYLFSSLWKRNGSKANGSKYGFVQGHSLLPVSRTIFTKNIIFELYLFVVHSKYLDPFSLSLSTF